MSGAPQQVCTSSVKPGLKRRSWCSESEDASPDKLFLTFRRKGSRSVQVQWYNDHGTCTVKIMVNLFRVLSSICHCSEMENVKF